jgi:hypothetical protein
MDEILGRHEITISSQSIIRKNWPTVPLVDRTHHTVHFFSGYNIVSIVLMQVFTVPHMHILLVHVEPFKGKQPALITKPNVSGYCLIVLQIPQKSAFLDISALQSACCI